MNDIENVILEEEESIKEVNISKEMKNSFLNYAMSVIVSRALPDVRDGMKPVHRRILFGMHEGRYTASSAYKKAARIVGEVMGKYHPHGDSSIYDAMVRLAQPFSTRYLLVDGQGNFGSIDGDGAAAMRYTEARMSKIAMEMLRDLDKNTVDFVDNYDASESEPSVLPARFPNLLVNGSTGIAVGMATNIPPHNLSEVIDGTLALMENPDIEIEELTEYIKGPDFPTGGLILGLTGLRKAYQTGNGSIVVRSKVDIQEAPHGKYLLIVTEIPYQVNKSRLIERIAEVAKEKIVEGITDLRDESNRNGIRIVIELRRDVNPHVMLNNLYKYTQLQVSYGINMIALVNNKPQTINLKDALVEYVKHQVEVLTRRTQFDLDKALAREHILEGFLIALENIDPIIQLIKESPDSEVARERLMSNYSLSEIQAREILNMRLQRLTGLEIEKIQEEERQLSLDIERFNEILASDGVKQQIIKDELMDVKNRFGDNRRSEISLSVDLDLEDEDLIPEEDVIITITANGYAKRMKIDTYKAQHRGGKGLTGIKTHEDDIVMHFLPTSTHDYLLFFTNKGRVYKIKGYQIPEGSRIARGLPIVNILGFDSDEELTALCNIRDFEQDDVYLLFATKRGIVKRTAIRLFKNIRSNGIIAINLNDGDELLTVIKATNKNDVILGASSGKSIRFRAGDMRDISRGAIGVRGIRLAPTDELVGVGLIESDDENILVISEKGFGKRSKAADYRTQGRGGIGVKTLNITEKNGKLKALKVVSDKDDLIVTTNKGMVIRCNIASISQTGRGTQGVILIRLNEGQNVSNVAVVPKEEESEFDYLLEEQLNDA